KRILCDQLKVGLPAVSLSIRCLQVGSTVLATVALVNDATPEATRTASEEASLFQVALKIKPCEGTFLVPKPPRHFAISSKETKETHGNSEVSDEEGNQLLFRNVLEFAVGHICSAHWERSSADNESPAT